MQIGLRCAKGILGGSTAEALGSVADDNISIRRNYSVTPSSIADAVLTQLNVDLSHS
jgi:hypothetical protein